LPADTPRPTIRLVSRAWPRISLVTPSFNQGAFIEETLRSVLDQGYPNLEYIVLDGGSTDGTLAVLDRYRDRLAYCVSEPDGGQTDALIKGLARATGEICGWLCSDDLLLPGSLERVARDCPKDGWLVGSARVLDAAGQGTVTVSHERYRRGDVLFNSYILNQVSVFWGSALYRRVRGLDRSLYYCMDFDLWTQFEAVCAPRVVPDTLGAFRVHPDAKTAAGDRLWDEILRTRARSLRGRPLARVAHRAHWTLRSQLAKLGVGAGVGNAFRDRASA
jgi:glycosyltransferase involved in cell wall biosynthesis